MNRSMLGFGLGLRTNHYESILSEKPAVDWFEILTENYLISGGKPHYYLEKIREHYTMVMHGVSMSIGSMDPLNETYLQQVKSLADKIQPRWISDHVCWTGVEGHNVHDLLPLPYTEETIRHVVSRIQQVQDFLGQQILIENVSSYLSFQHSEIMEWDFLKEISERADCFILLDVNNVYINAINHAFDPLEYIYAIPKERILQIHLAGHSNRGTHIIDTHDHDISDPVWKLYADTLRHCGLVSTMIERDDNIPPLDKMLLELNHARKLAESVCAPSCSIIS